MLTEAEWLTIVEDTSAAIATRGEPPYFELAESADVVRARGRCPLEVQTRAYVAWQELPALLQVHCMQPALAEGVPARRLATLCSHLVEAWNVDMLSKLEEQGSGEEPDRPRDKVTFAARLWGLDSNQFTEFEFESKGLKRYFRSAMPLSAVCTAIRAAAPELTRRAGPRGQILATLDDEGILGGPWIQLCAILRDRLLTMLDEEARWALWTKQVVPVAFFYNRAAMIIFHPDHVDLCGLP